MSDTFHWDDTTTVSRDGVTVEREIEGRDDGIIVTMDLRADVSGPLTVEVLDEFPADLPARQAGFNVEYEPDDGDLSLERARIRHTIEEESTRVVYAIRLAQPVDAVAFDDPSIVDVALPGLSGGDDPADESMIRGDGSDGDEDEDEDVDAGSEGSERENVAFDSSGFESRSATDLSAETAPDEGEAADTAEATDAPTGRADGPSVDGAPEPDGAADEQTRAAGPDAEAIERAIAETERSLGEASDGTDDGAGPDDASADEAATDDGPVDRDPSGVDGAGDPEQPPGAGSHGSADGTGTGSQGAASGSDFATGQQQSDPTGPVAGRDAPADAGGSAGTGGPGRAPGAAPRGTPAADETGAAAGAGAGDEMSRSVRLRLDRLNARVEEFATYAEALEDIIEREGTGPEIIENLESNLTETTERLESVRADVDDLQSAHDEDVATVRDRIDELEEELETARSDLRSDVVNVRGTVDDIGADVERVDHETSENAEEVQSVREHLETVESAVHSLDDRVDDHEDELEEVGDTVASVQTDVAELTESVEAMRSDVESLQTDVDRLLRFREILSDVFGGPVQRATEASRDLDDRPGDDRQDDGSVSAPSEPSR